MWATEQRPGPWCVGILAAVLHQQVQRRAIRCTAAAAGLQVWQLICVTVNTGGGCKAMRARGGARARRPQQRRACEHARAAGGSRSSDAPVCPSCLLHTADLCSIGPAASAAAAFTQVRAHAMRRGMLHCAHTACIGCAQEITARVGVVCVPALPGQLLPGAERACIVRHAHVRAPAGAHAPAPQLWNLACTKNVLHCNMMLPQRRAGGTVLAACALPAACVRVHVWHACTRTSSLWAPMKPYIGLCCMNSMALARARATRAGGWS